ncbi:unnamed protein product [Echinostoma caproni]|uniref:Uncharacterized protein n=1 Tax=Echinostoma caproni TaxID=27848 RepID=A0A183A072_9TREM|nr:unnamed protein product [Echinostoma caproni]
MTLLRIRELCLMHQCAYVSGAPDWECHLAEIVCTVKLISIGLNRYDSLIDLDLDVSSPDLVRWILVDVDDVFLHGSGVDFTVQDAVASRVFL